MSIYRDHTHPVNMLDLIQKCFDDGQVIQKRFGDGQVIQKQVPHRVWPDHICWI